MAMGISLLEHGRNEEILEEAKVEPIAMVMRRCCQEGPENHEYQGEMDH